MPFSNSEKHACVQRELKMRQRVYPRWIESGRMTQAKADTGIEVMREISNDYARLAAGERLL